MIGEQLGICIFHLNIEKKNQGKLKYFIGDFNAIEAKNHFG